MNIKTSEMLMKNFIEENPELKSLVGEIPEEIELILNWAYNCGLQDASIEIDKLLNDLGINKMLTK